MVTGGCRASRKGGGEAEEASEEEAMGKQKERKKERERKKEGRRKEGRKARVGEASSPDKQTESETHKKKTP